MYQGGGATEETEEYTHTHTHTRSLSLSHTHTGSLSHTHTPLHTPLHTPQCVMTSLPGRGQVLQALCGRAPGGAGSARRRLFGSVDHEKLQRDYTLMMRAELEDASRRWSFDIAAHKPRRGGDFEWVELSEARVPFLYRDCKVGSQPKGAWPRLKKEDVPTTPESCDRTPNTLKRKQTNITDFYQAKRRVVTTRKSGQ